MKFLVHVSQWAYGDGDEPVVFKGGEHELDNPDPGLLAAIAAAHDAGGAIEILDTAKAVAKTVAAHVETDKVSLQLQAKCEAIRHELLPERDAALDALAAAHATRLRDPSDSTDAEAAAFDFAAAHVQILEQHELRVDEEIRSRLGGVV